MFRKTLTASITALCIASSALAQDNQRYSLKGVQLGITLEQFKAVPIPTDVGEAVEIETLKQFKLPPLNRQYRTDCSQRGSLLACQWVKADPPRFDLRQERTPFANGSGYIDFLFVDAPDGAKRLATISVQSNMVQFDDLLSAYRANYGTAKVSAERVQNTLGATFEQQVFTWSNGENKIEMRTICGRANYLCIEYSNLSLEAVSAEARRRALVKGPVDF